MSVDRQAEEDKLDALAADVRREALKSLIRAGSAFPPATDQVNLHAHTFFSYNPLGYSPTHFAWLAKQAGLAVAGIVDFDVLDGVAEFHEAGSLLGLKTCASIETRVFVPELADQVINSPGEPGIAYHMGVGFTEAEPQGEAAAFLGKLSDRAAKRTLTLIEKVNAYLAPLVIDFEHDLAPLTPGGNATERHACRAYAAKAASRFKDPADVRAFWNDKLGALPEDLDLPAGPKLQALIRAKTMKRGGVGYVQPDQDAFPLLADMDRFSLQCGAIPTIAWLDGTSEGESDMERFIAIGRASGVAALNIIPDRNFTHGVKDEKLGNLYALVDLAEKEHLPVIVGTEMNSPGQRFVDDFACEELRPLVPLFMKGAYIVYAHTVLQRRAGMGYLSPWAEASFTGTDEKNAFYAEFGQAYQPGDKGILASVSTDSTPDDLMGLVSA